MTPGQKAKGDTHEHQSHVFLSYARTDRVRAEKVVNLLANAGIKVWWDDMVEGGETFRPVIEQALETAECVVVLWSENSVDSNWVRDEAQTGADHACLVPVTLDGTMPPLGFRQFQTIDASRWKGVDQSPEGEQILSAVKARLGTPNQLAPRPKARTTGFTISRRGLAAGGLGLAGGTALALWGLDIFPSGSNGKISLAVMPFANLSNDTEQAWFSLGLSNELRAALARNTRLKVSAPTSSSLSNEAGQDEFEVARMLGVANVLRGSVQLAAGTARISVELIEVAGGLVQWAESFDRQLEDVFAVQTEIAQTVALSLLEKFAGEDEARRSLLEQEAVGGTANLIAYEAYLRGQAFYDISAGQQSDRAALAQFEAAIAADPEFAAAHAMRATMLAAVANSTSQASEVRTLYDQSVAAARRSIELAPGLAQGHFALGFALNNGRLDRRAAAPHYKRARELAPGEADILRAVATFLGFGEAAGEARRLIDEALELDPLNARAFRTAGYIAFLSRDYPHAITRMEQALKLNPKLASAPYCIGSALYMQGDFKGALEQFRLEAVPIFALTGQAIALHELGNESEASAALEGLVSQYGDAALYQQAQVAAQWGETESALDLLKRAMAAFDPGMLFLPNDPILDPLRERPQFETLRSALSA